ncbi:splicing factor, Prp19-binding domain-domain-containing protein [Catenaria anguillulae PL171]|uniref:Splicing factor, Prp19-binding domain-domain-containing protein n=1 Tax=Catenaria anguillulae PL171 TaxID=765915 RepID=A0A1Y2I1G7_9FUNG|nr:splicing factor, Prp19-binding domain-domain-containing protein [Catenaria anguillulae PL171]
MNLRRHNHISPSAVPPQPSSPPVTHMSKIAAVPSLNKKGDTILQPVKVQRYRRGQAPVGASYTRSDDDDDSDDSDNDSDGGVHDDNGITGPTAADDDQHGLAVGRGPKSLAVSRTLGFASSTSATGHAPRKAYVAIDVTSASASATAANAAAAAASDPRLRRLAALAAASAGNQRRRARTTSSGSSGSESSEDDKKPGEGRAARGAATLEAQAERRLLLQQKLLEAEAEEGGRMKGGKAVGEDLGGSGSGSGSEEESSEESSSEDEEEEAPAPAMRIKPKFVPKFQRKTVPDTATQLHESTTHPSATTSAARRAESRALVQSEIQRAQTELAEHALAISAVDDTDDLDPAAEYAAWRERELARLRRALEQRRAHEAELAELERRRNLTPEERALEAERVAREREQAQQAKPKVKFMQKYYHKGAFYMGDEAVGKKDARGVLQRDATEARPDHFNYEVVPEVMQRKNFGLAGQTKWTHLAKEDTSNKRDAGWFKDKKVVERMERKRGGMGDVDGGLARKRNRGD